MAYLITNVNLLERQLSKLTKHVLLQDKKVITKFKFKNLTSLQTIQTFNRSLKYVDKMVSMNLC